MIFIIIVFVVISYKSLHLDSATTGDGNSASSKLAHPPASSDSLAPGKLNFPMKRLIGGESSPLSLSLSLKAEGMI